MSGCNFLKPAKVIGLTADVIGVCERTVRRPETSLILEQITREDLEPEFGKRGRKKKELPEWCSGAIREIIISM